MTPFLIRDSGGIAYLVIASSVVRAKLLVSRYVRHVGVEDLDGDHPSEIHDCRALTSGSLPGVFVGSPYDVLLLETKDADL